MLTIAGGIVLGFFAIAFMLAFGEAILKFVGGLLVLGLFMAGLGLAFYLISLIPYATDVLVGLFLVVIFGGLALGALVALYSTVKSLFERLGILFGALTVVGLAAAPAVFYCIIFYIFAQPTSGADFSEWLSDLMVAWPAFAVIWGLLFAWELWTTSMFVGSSKVAGKLLRSQATDQSARVSGR